MVTHIVIDIPTSVLASFLRFCKPLVCLEVPIHVRHLLLPSLIIRLETSTTLGALRTQLLKERRDQMRLESRKG